VNVLETIAVKVAAVRVAFAKRNFQMAFTVLILVIVNLATALEASVSAALHRL
jgi:hypothetical protein